MRYYNFSLFQAIDKNSKLWAVNKLSFRAFFSTKVSEPLRILFFGSDRFSSASLKAICDEKNLNPDFIKSIEVVCRPGKKVGRGLKKISKAPIKVSAQEIGLRVYEVERLKEWQLPKPDGETINLIIAVSFGLFIPSRILKSVKYGGINLHPSLLPDFRGPAPLQRTLLAGRKFTGVTLQTLDHENFDQGIILDQTVPPIEIPRLCTHERLLEILAPNAAKMLVKGLNQRLFVPPLQPVGRTPQKGKNLTYAKKITPEDSQMPWYADDQAFKIVQTYCALGPLWSFVYGSPKELKRLIFDDIELGTQEKCNPNEIFDVSTTAYALEKTILQPVYYYFVPVPEQAKRAKFYYESKSHKGSVNLLFPTKDPGVWSSVRVGKVTIEGKPTVTAKQAFDSLRQERRRYLNFSKGIETSDAEYIVPYPLQD